jgi:hypothetical protein
MVRGLSYGNENKISLSYYYLCGFKQVAISIHGSDVKTAEEFLNDYLMNFGKTGVSIDITTDGERLIVSRISVDVYIKAISDEEIEEKKNQLMGMEKPIAVRS